MKTELVKINPNEFGIEETQAKDLTKGLQTILKERQVLIEAYEDTISLEITEENLSTFKELRLLIRDNRTKGIEPWHKSNKAFFLAGGRFVDAIKNKEVQENERMEEALLKAEKHFENIEKERILKLHEERKIQVEKYTEDSSGMDFGNMHEDVFNNYLTGVKVNYEAKIEAEKKAEQERLEQERLSNLKISRENKLKLFWKFVPENHPPFETLSYDEWSDFIKEMENAKDLFDKEQEKIKLENERLQKEAEEKEKKRIAEEKERERLAKIEAKKQEAERKANEEKARIEKEKHEAELKKEREEKQRVESQLKAKQEAERKAKEDEEKRIQSELSKGDSEKVKDLVNDLVLLKSKYQFKSVKNIKMYNDVGLLIDKIVDHINK